jgi:hypothetical protein
MDGNWQRHSALDKYKAPREDFKIHGESWVDGARELDCYRATTGVPIGSKQMARQAQGTKQHGAHIYIIGAICFNRSCSLGLNTRIQRKPRPAKNGYGSLLLPLPISGSSRRVVGPLGALVYVKHRHMAIQGPFPSRCTTTILRPFLLPVLDLFTKRIGIVSFFLSIRLNDHLFYCS